MAVATTRLHGQDANHLHGRRLISHLSLPLSRHVYVPPAAELYTVAHGSPLPSTRCNLRRRMCFAAVDKPAAPAEEGLLGTAEQQKAAYTALMAVYALLGLGMTLNPGSVFSVALKQPATELLTGLLGVVASFYWLAVGALACLKDAAHDSRLTSDTYKRLNLAMTYFCITTIVLEIRFRSISNAALLSGSVGLSLLTIFICGRTYAWSNGGFSLPTVLKGALSGLKDMLQPKTADAAVYSLLTAVYFMCWALMFATDAHPLFLGDIGVLGQYLKRKIGAGMLLAGVVHYVLKDAADRGRLGASTFRLLNLSAGLYSIVGGWYFYRMWAAGVPVLEPLMVSVLGMSVLTVGFCDWQYLFAKK